jgi:sporulation protein YlmC with PRC-barrel domain
MNTKFSVIMTLFVAALFFLATPAFAAMTEGNASDLNPDLAKVMKGSIVYNNQGQVLGTVNHVVLGDNGQISYIILARDSVHWGGLTAYYSTPAWVNTGVRLIPIPYNEVTVRRIPDRAAHELAQGEPFYGSRPIAFESPAMPTDHAYWTFTPKSVAMPEGKIFWGSLPPALFSPAYPDQGTSRTYLNRHVEVNISEEALANAPSFSPNDWAKFANSQFKQTVHAYYEQAHPGQAHPGEQMMKVPADQSHIY